jgi:RNA polymerase sigma-70 factor (ECF subfamily)
MPGSFIDYGFIAPCYRLLTASGNPWLPAPFPAISTTLRCGLFAGLFGSRPNAVIQRALLTVSFPMIRPMPEAGKHAAPRGILPPWPHRAGKPVISAGPAGEAERMTMLLVRLAAGPDREAFAGLFAFYAPRLKAYMRRLGADGPAAEDLTQEAMAAVWNKARMFDPGKSNAGTWIFTIARNLRIDVLRRERRPAIDFSDPALLPDEPDSPEQIIASRRDAATVRAALAGLPAEQARIVELSFFEGQPHSTIARELGVPLGTVKSRLRLAFQRFRKALEQYS